MTDDEDEDEGMELEPPDHAGIISMQHRTFIMTYTLSDGDHDYSIARAGREG